METDIKHEGYKSAFSLLQKMTITPPKKATQSYIDAILNVLESIEDKLVNENEDG